MSVPVKLSGEYYGTREAAEKLDRTEGRIRQMIRWNELSAIEISPRSWLIPAEEVARILKARIRRDAS